VRPTCEADANTLVNGGVVCGSKRAIGLVCGDRLAGSGACQGELVCEKDQPSTDSCADSVPSLSELWGMVSHNGQRIMELQAQQGKLFKELKALQEWESGAQAGTRHLQDVSNL